MSSRTARTLVATAPDGTEVTQQTSGGYTVAGLIQNEGGQWFIARHGWSWDSVKNRTSMLYGRGYYKAWHVADLIEATAPILREYFGTHNVSIISVWWPSIYEELTEAQVRSILVHALPRDVDHAIAAAKDYPGEDHHASVHTPRGYMSLAYAEDGTFTITPDSHVKHGWTPVGGSRPAGKSALRELAREGATAIEVRGPDGRTADFQVPELIKSMNARKA